jgi:hypothetical protein
MLDPLAGWQQLSPRVRALRLLRWAAVGVVVAAPLVMAARGTGGLVALAAAAAVCTVGALLAQGITALAGSTLNAFGGLAVGLVLRMLVPLLACGLIDAASPQGPLAEGAFYLLTVVFYLYLLAVDCHLAIPRRDHSCLANE